MKATPIRARKSAAIPNSRWLAYATAGAASAFACGHPDSAEGSIHYSGPINRIINRTERVSFQLDQPGDFIWLFDRTGTAYHGYDWFGAQGLSGAAFVGFYGSCCFARASNLERGQLISNNPFIPAVSGLLVPCLDCQFKRGIGFIGFKFNNGSGDQYGWVRIHRYPSFGEKFRLIDFAYGDVGDRIQAGQKSDDQAVPDERSLGWLALGAVGLLSWRTRPTSLDHTD